MRDKVTVGTYNHDKRKWEILAKEHRVELVLGGARLQVSTAVDGDGFHIAIYNDDNGYDVMNLMPVSANSVLITAAKVPDNS